MCLDIKCIDYNNNKICYECSQKNDDEYLKEQIEHGSLVKCDTCGYIWDGNAQCPCWNEQINDSEEESHNEVIGNIYENPKLIKSGCLLLRQSINVYKTLILFLNTNMMQKRFQKI